MTVIADRPRLTSARVLHSEWVKLTTVRSTYWTSAVALALAVLATLAIGLATRPDRVADSGLLLLGSTVSLSFVALVVGVLGVLAIGGEYATLQLRSSYTAVPRRWPALVAKAVVVGLWSLALGLVIDFGAFGLLALLYGARGIEVVADGALVGGLVGGAVSLAVVAVFAVGLGALVRSSAAGISILTAILFVLPIVLGLIGGLLNAAWATTASHHLLDAAAGDLHASPGTSALPLWAVAVTLVAWIAAVWAPALVTTIRRDV